jgi:hypothetical protein
MFYLQSDTYTDAFGDVLSEWNDCKMIVKGMEKVVEQWIEGEREWAHSLKLVC